jgi:galactokinase
MNSNTNYDDEITVKAPGRVNLLGEHVDYNGGIVLPVAIDRQVTLRASLIQEPLISLYAKDLDTRVRIPIDHLEEKCDEFGDPLPGFALYPAGVAWALRKNGLEVSGIEAEFTSNIPIGAGLSSSAAIEVAFALAWQHFADWDIERMRLVRICQQSENEYVGVNSGIMDQFSSAFGKQGHALSFDTGSLDWEPIPLPKDIAIVIADSGVRHTLVGSGYNDRRQDCEEGLRKLQEFIPDAKHLRDIQIEQFYTHKHLLNDRERKRVRFVIEEIDRVFQAVDFLKQGNVAAFGELMFATHAGLRDLYEVSTPENDTLVDIASKLDGCYGARITGGGFGGCTVNLVDESHVDSFISTLHDQYQNITGRSSDIYLCHASDGAQIVAG